MKKNWGFGFTFGVVLRLMGRETKNMDKAEFDILSQKIRPKLVSVARNFASVSGGIDAEDIVQEALLALWELSESGYPVRHVESLAIKITKNTCVSHYRRCHLDTVSLTHDNYLGGQETTYYTDVEDLRKIKRSIYDTLSETQREYLYLRNEEGLSLDEIATATGNPRQVSNRRFPEQENKCWI